MSLSHRAGSRFDTTSTFRPYRSRRGIATVVIAVLVAGCHLFGVAFAATGASALERHTFYLSSGSTAYGLDYWSNVEIGTADPAVRRVVVVVHGDSRNASDYGRYTGSAALAAGVATSTMVVAPRFVADVDSPRGDQLYWTPDSWKDGNESGAEGRSWTMASFRVMDALLAALRNDYPAVTIVLAGHSAGGQFVQRYAASNGARAANRYVPMNPGSYMYLDNRRWADGSLRPLSPDEIRSCRGYNSYKYGLDVRPTALFSSSTAVVTSTYLASSVTYLLGEADTTRDSELNTGCAAEWEGANRFERGTRFFAALRSIPGAASSHQLVTVAGVGHEASRMINSSQAAPLLFSPEPATPVTPQTELPTTTAAPTPTPPAPNASTAPAAAAPGTMSPPHVVVRGNEATVKWKVAAPNGSPLTQFLIDISKGTDKVAKAFATKLKFKALRPGRYRVRVAARNAIGTAPYSSWVKFRI